jgi:O-acetyl-ADP-ribose deacetylase (regulator of RNase III)
MVAEENHCRTVAFPCISTGVYGYDKQRAAHVAMAAVRDYLVDKSAEQKNPVSGNMLGNTLAESISPRH